VLSSLTKLVIPGLTILFNLLLLDHHSFILSLSNHPPPCQLLLTTSFFLSYLAHLLIHPLTPYPPPHSALRHLFRHLIQPFILAHQYMHSCIHSVRAHHLINPFASCSPPHSSFHYLLSNLFILLHPVYHLTHPFTPCLHHLIHPYAACSPPHLSFHFLLTTSFSFSLPVSPHPSISPSLHFSPLNYSFIHRLSTSVSCILPLFTPSFNAISSLSHLLQLSLTNGRGEWQHLGSRESAVLPGPQQQLPHPQPLSPSAPHSYTPRHYAMI